MSRLTRYLLILAGLVFLGSIVWSMIFETLVPLLRQGDTLGFWRHVAGMPVILAGTILFAWGGWVFVRDTSRLTADPDYVSNHVNITAGETRASVNAARRAQWATLLRAWRPGLTWLAVGFGLIALGSAIINI